ncbi:MAG: sulfatase family protein [Oceanipulchritudo sp.]
MKILYIDIDSCRPDHLGCYGYHRDTSPNIDAIAREGVRFNKYYTSDAPCLPSRTALYTGMFGIHSGVVGHGGTAADPRLEGAGRGFRNKYENNALPRLLQERGFYTAQVSPFGQRHSAHHFYAGFHEMHNTGKGGNESAEEVQPVVLGWLERNAAGRDNWYLHVNYWDPHTPFRVPMEFGNPFADDPLPEWLTDEVLEGHQQSVGPHSANEISGMYSDKPWGNWPREVNAVRSREDLKRHIDGYDTGIRYVDTMIGEIVEKLKAAGIYDEVTIIISADHGENQGELGIYSEHGTADEITCRVPLIIKGPGVRKGTDEGLHYNIDLAPTLAEWTDTEPKPTWDGRSFLASVQSEQDTGRDFLVISQCAHVCQRSVRFGPWLYMRTYHDGFHLFPKEMLFNIERDPHEQHNLAEEMPEICNEALRHLSDWHDEMMMTMPYDNDPLWTVMREGGPQHAKMSSLPGYFDHLKKTGRGWAIKAIKERHGEP